MPKSEIEKNKFSKIEKIFDDFKKQLPQNYFEHQKEFDSLLTNLKNIFRIALPIDIKTPDEKDETSQSPFLVDEETYQKMASDSNFKIQKVESLLENFATSIAQDLNSIDTSLLDQDNYENLLNDFFAILSEQLTEEVELQTKKGRKPQEYVEPRLVFFANLAEKIKFNNPFISQKIDFSLQFFLFKFKQDFHQDISFKEYRDQYQINQSELNLGTEPSNNNADPSKKDPADFMPQSSLPNYLNTPNFTDFYQTQEFPNTHEENSNLRQQISNLGEELLYANQYNAFLGSAISNLQQQINIQAPTPEQYKEIVKREISILTEEFSKAGREISSLFSKKLGDTQDFVNTSFHELIESNLDSFRTLLNFFSQTDQTNQANFREIRNELAEIKRDQQNGITDQQRREESQEDGIANQPMMQELMKKNSQILELLEILSEKLDNSRKEIQELQDRITELEEKKQSREELEKDNTAKQQRIQELEKDNIANQQRAQELQDRIKELETKQQRIQELEKDNIAKQQRAHESEELNAKLITDKKTSDNQENENVTSDKNDSKADNSSPKSSQQPKPTCTFPNLIEPETGPFGRQTVGSLKVNSLSEESRSSSSE